jgi:hypothetical protein
MLKRLREYEREKGDAQANERRRKSSYGRRMERKARTAPTPRQKAVERARIFRLLNPEKHRASMAKWERNNREKRSAIMRLYYVKNREAILAKVKARNEALGRNASELHVEDVAIC